MLGFDSPVLKLTSWTVSARASKSLWPVISQISDCMDHDLSSYHLPEHTFMMALESLLDSDTGLIQIFAVVEKTLVSRTGAAVAHGRK